MEKSIDHHRSHMNNCHQSLLFPFNYWELFHSSQRTTGSKCSWTVWCFARKNCFNSGREILIDYRQRFRLLYGPTMFYYFPLKGSLRYWLLLAGDHLCQKGWSKTCVSHHKLPLWSRSAENIFPERQLRLIFTSTVAVRGETTLNQVSLLYVCVSISDSNI